MNKLIDFFVRRPLLVNLLMVFIIVMGLLVSSAMKYEVFPKIDLGIINISTYRPGAGPEDIELSITVPLEEELLKVDGLKKVSSNSMEGISVITIRLDPGIEDKRQALSDIQKAVDRATVRLPADLPEKPLVEEMSSLKFPVMELHLIGKVPEQVLRRTARQLADALREVEGISSVEKVGYRRSEVRILLDPDRLQHLGLSIREIREAIVKRNVRDTGGSLESFVAEKKVLTVGQFQYPKQVQEVIIRSHAPGNAVKIRDVAQVVMDYEDWQVQSRTDGALSIALLARKKAEADGLKNAQAVRSFLHQQRPNLPPGVQIVPVNDISRFTYDMLDTLGSNALLGLVLVFLTLWLFLNLRLSLWVSLGMPVAILLSFTLMPLFGLGIDVLTITALILVLGMVVDDAVVTAEAIELRRERNITSAKASIGGAASMAAPVIVSTLTTVLAFTPVIFLGGLEGKFLWALPVMVALVLVASLFECLFLLPGHMAHGSSRRPRSPRRWFKRIQQTYDRFILVAIKRRYLTTAMFVAGYVAILAFGAATLRFNLYPEVDIDTVNLKVELPEGASFEYTTRKVLELEQLVRSHVLEQDLLNITTRIGHHDTDPYGSTEGRNPAWALLTLYMRPQGERETNSNKLIAELREQVKPLEGFRSIIVEPLKDTPVAGKPVELEIIGNDVVRFDLADAVVDYLGEYQGITEVWTSYKQGKDIVELDLDHEKLASRGLTVADVTQSVRLAFDGLLVDELQTVDERIRYRLQFIAQAKGKMQTLQSLVLINTQGLPVFLRDIADFEIRPGEAAIKHYFGQRTLTIYADIDRALVSVEQINQDIAQWIEDQQWLKRYPRLRLWYGGELEQQRESLGNIGMAFLVCSIAIFFLLVLLFNSLTQPFLIMLTIPFGLAGVIVGFIIQGLPLSLIALIGVLGLVGVLVNDSLVMVHTLNRTRKFKQTALSDAEISLGARNRLRPIVITSATTVAALFPTAYGIAGSNPFITPMVMAMAWGILFGTIISLVLLPCLYAIEQDLRKGLYRGWRWLGQFRAGSAAG